MNKVILMGNVGGIDQHSGVVKMSLATNKKYKNQGGETVKETQWHRLVCFKRQAEVAAQYVKVGDKLLVEGELKYGSYTDNAGVERYTTDIICHNFQMLGGANSDGKRANSPSPSANNKRRSTDSNVANHDDFEDDTIPF